ncbi:hypothetical protein SAMN02745121_08139 [Nannocystis exedens]|uniref:Uncharacterized protein n=1 Tax=Nannocystis exedens TaxID=54 RepID=A0A1I2HRN5_9BACT|nr:hypothetical protein NAEX_02427 [Nannocystis exedens]SFF32198.1 hypothetical protein SAMN02745121_08139 [Nannocystis exedens]
MNPGSPFTGSGPNESLNKRRTCTISDHTVTSWTETHDPLYQGRLVELPGPRLQRVERYTIGAKATPPSADFPAVGSPDSTPPALPPHPVGRRLPLDLPRLRRRDRRGAHPAVRRALLRRRGCLARGRPPIVGGWQFALESAYKDIDSLGNPLGASCYYTDANFPAGVHRSTTRRAATPTSSAGAAWELRRHPEQLGRLRPGRRLRPQARPPRRQRRLLTPVFRAARDFRSHVCPWHSMQVAEIGISGRIGMALRKNPSRSDRVLRFSRAVGSPWDSGAMFGAHNRERHRAHAPAPNCLLALRVVGFFRSQSQHRVKAERRRALSRAWSRYVLREPGLELHSAPDQSSRPP